MDKFGQRQLRKQGPGLRIPLTADADTFAAAASHRRPPSKLGEIQPDHWLAEYTTEIINVLNVLGRLIEIEPQQSTLLEQVCAGLTISVEELRTAGAFQIPASSNHKLGRKNAPEQSSFLD